jgi:hypothetical protein
MNYQTNCLTVTMFDAALAHAKKLDEHFASTGKTVGPLHGLPVSLKDNFNIPGYPSSVGFTSWALEPMQQESTIVTILRELGAVAYVKTNVPTAMMIAETVNNCYGRYILFPPHPSSPHTNTTQNNQPPQPRPNLRRLLRRRIRPHRPPRLPPRHRHRHRRQPPHPCRLHRHLHNPAQLWSVPALRCPLWARGAGEHRERAWADGEEHS